MQFLRKKEVKIKKPRACWGCGHTHNPGVKMHYNVCVDSGTIIDSYWCYLCKGYMDACREKGESFDDGIFQGSFRGEETYLDFIREKTFFKKELLIEKYPYISHGVRRWVEKSIKEANIY